MTVIHKMIKGPHGEQLCLCKSPGRKMQHYLWKNVNCKICLSIKELELNDRQMREVARIRYESEQKRNEQDAR